MKNEHTRKTQWSAFWTGWMAASFVSFLLNGNVAMTIAAAAIGILLLGFWMLDRGFDEQWPTLMEVLRRREHDD